MSREDKPVVLYALVLAVAMAGFWFCGCGKRDSAPGLSGSKAAGEQDSEILASAKSRPTYVGRDSCVECHAEAVTKWEGSHHFHAMELPNEKTVRADFNGTTFKPFPL